MSKLTTVLVVDDETKITAVVKSYLDSSGYRVFCTHGGKQALNIFNAVKPDLIILDLMLPDMSGEDICGEIRKVSKVPIIMLSAKSQEDDMLTGLDLGADDYITKPFSPRELMGRVRAVLRRYEDNSGVIAEILSFDDGYLVINNTSHEVKANGNLVSLTPNEYKILLTLCKNPNKVYSREELVTLAFGYDYEGQDRAIDTHVKNLRVKIEKDNKRPQLILTVHGVGYKFGGK
ncbi:MAG: response regulator [Thermincolia bacterium]